MTASETTAGRRGPDQPGQPPARRLRTGARAGLGLLSGALLLAACGESEVILPGVREDIRGVLENPEPVPAAREDRAEATNRAKPLALPAPRVNASWPQRPVAPQDRPAHPALGANLQLAWSADIGEGDSRRYRIAAEPVVAQGAIFTMDSRARVTATSPGGQTLWTRDLTPGREAGDAGGGALAYGGGKLYVTSGYGRLAALDPATGRPVWTQDLDASTTAAPAYRDGLVYLVAGDRTAWAIEAESGRIRWQNDSLEDVSNVYGGPAPAVTDKLVITGFGSGEVQGAFAKGGMTLWTATVAGRRDGRALSVVDDLTGDPVVADGRVYVGNVSGRTAALDAANGERLWTADFGTMGPVWPVGDALFLVSDLGELLRVDAASGERVWGVELPGFTRDRVRKRAEIFPHHGPVVAGGRVIVASGDGLLRQFDPVSGRLVGSVRIPGGASTAPVVAGGTLYLVNRDGELLAFR